MAFISIVSSWKSCYILVNGDASIAWFERKKVSIGFFFFKFISALNVIGQLKCNSFAK